MLNKLAPARDKLLIADGALGTELHRLGVPYGANLDQANLTHPKLVAEVHRSYIEAGARLIETNTFGANVIRLAQGGLATQTAEINKAAVVLARQAIKGSDAVLAGAIGPLGRSLAPVGNLSRDEAYEAFAAQAAVLAGEGVDLILLETFADLEEVMTAARAALTTGLPVLVSLAFDAEGYTAAGLSVRAAVTALAALPLLGIGANCGAGPEGISRVAAEMADLLPSEKLLCLMPSAGQPQRLAGRTVYRSGPDYFAAAAARLAGLGADIIGGCCGIGPAHIKALAGLVDGRAVTPRHTQPSAPAAAAPGLEQQCPPFLEKLKREFVCTVELSPPKGADPIALIEAARALKHAGADAVNIADGPMARVRMSSIALAHRLQEETGMESILHLTCRDRNLIGLQADLLGAAALGIRNILALTGDPPHVGDHPQATAVFDVNAAGLVKIMTELNQGRDLAGNALGRATGFAVGVAVNPLSEDSEGELGKLQAKLAAGADFCVTQPIFAPALAQGFLRRIAALGVPIVIGLWPLRSLRQTEYLSHEVPGMVIPGEALDRMRNSPADRQAETGVLIALEILETLRPLCAGACLMPGGDVDLALRMLRGIHPTAAITRGSEPMR